MPRILILLAVLAPVLICGCSKSRSERGIAEKIKIQDARTAPLIASKSGRVYHTRECPYAGTLDSPVGYATVYEAECTGHIPCEFCYPHHSEAKQTRR